MNDGISSGASRVSRPQRVNDLLNNPNAMQFAFFSPEEVSGIMLTSDGANALMYKNIDGVLFSRLSKLSNAEIIMSNLRNDNVSCNDQLYQMCLKYSAQGSYSGGSGDDCSLVYIKYKQEK